MTYRVLLRKEPANGYVAIALDWPGCQVTAPTRAAALERIQVVMSDILHDSEIVELEMVEGAAANSYEKTFGAFRDDPTYTGFLNEVEQYRQAHN
jgi:predicted RNase H-like HicB family nuclease